MEELDERLWVQIVHEDPTVSKSWTDALTKAGYLVDSTGSSLHAFDRIMKLRPDVIVMAYKLAYMNGVDQATVLSMDDNLKDIPIILVVAPPFASDHIEIRGEPGAKMIVEILQWPFEPTVLLEKVASVVKKYVDE